MFYIYICLNEKSNEFSGGRNYINGNFLLYDLILGSSNLKTITNKAKYVSKAIVLVNKTYPPLVTNGLFLSKMSRLFRLLKAAMVNIAPPNATKTSPIP